MHPDPPASGPADDQPEIQVSYELDDSLAVPIDIDCARLARQLKHSSRRTIGCAPAPAKIDVKPLIYQLAMAVSRITRKVVFIVDPIGTWPGRGERDAVAEALIARDDPLFFSARFLESGVALIDPRETPPPGARVQFLRIVIQHLRAAPNNYALSLIDITSFDRIGEFLESMDMLDGVLTVGQSGVTREDDLYRIRERLPDEVDLGVILTTT